MHKFLGTAGHLSNRLLDSMLDVDLELVTRGGEMVELHQGEELAVPGGPIDHCWFPVSGLISVIARDAAGCETEVGVVGRDGVANLPVLLGGFTSPLRLLVQISGAAVRVDARTLWAVVQERPALLRLMLAYVQSMQVQMASSTLALARYTIPQRLARWLLMCADRIGSDNIRLTHESLALMLSVRRAGVSVALAQLAERGAVVSGRGWATILDRKRLLEVAGAGYGHAEAEYRRLVEQVGQPSANEGAYEREDAAAAGAGVRRGV